ncbi:epoxide hydrolase [Solwaraspora sp. WMMA2056]|uniref:epoxide hydrolase family protein n=1 Tax=Solwaraspora sp. WMMA2056 TaxID=3015161 RepID=UPI00259BEC13|nr:epoxide hydrolase family protein [Solwaraspora sp. WMMA2056]WJK38624.1 epoxide hydrolase [Solwaraspora sp. WMMA2056]
MEPFRIEIPQESLDDLAARLAGVRWPVQPVGAGWERGVPVGYLRDLVGYWRSGYDWRAAEARLNKFPQFVAEVDGARVHFLHVRSPEPGAVPLVVTHGWPGSFVEFLEVVGPLADPRGFGGDPGVAFDVVVPTIPGFGFSGPVSGTGWTLPRVAGVWAELMRRLGYDRYALHGGDFGSLISLEVARQHPARVLGVHVNFLVTGVDTAADPDLSDAERGRLATMARFHTDPAGYVKVQATRPHTLAFGLTDSPVGQLAWIVEKFREWTDPTSALPDAVDRDTLLTNVMLYWLTGTAGSSAALYYEIGAQLRAGAPPVAPWPTEVPVAVAVFPHDFLLPVRRQAMAELPTITRWTEFAHGGHFPALEQPELLVTDLRAFFADRR